MKLAPIAAEGGRIVFRCRRCDNVSDRPAAYLMRRFGAATLEEVAARASCLAYLKGVRCGARGVVEISAAPAPLAATAGSSWGPPPGLS